jgi:hypothetical protein
VGLAAVATGSDLIKEPFRWDQRVFATVLKLPAAGTAGSLTAASEEKSLGPADSSLSVMCEITGGRCVAVTGMRALLQNMVRRSPPPLLKAIHFLPVRCVCSWSREALKEGARPHGDCRRG